MLHINVQKENCRLSDKDGGVTAKKAAVGETEYDMRSNIYSDIAQRCGGDIYIGVVGPVRTGKSTFIKRFTETLVIPNITDKYGKERARDEMPQSAAGRTVMTTEPKFIPDEAVKVSLADNAEMKVRMIDCVGYIIPDVLGHTENGEERMVSTPWSKEPMPFAEAAELGTRKVIAEHSTIGIVVTTDGTIGEIPRENYIGAEERVVNELKEINKPFAVILNSAHPEAEAAQKLGLELEEKYNVPVALVNCLELNSDDIREILELVLKEFPITEIGVALPEWAAALDRGHPIKESIVSCITSGASSISKTGQISGCFADMDNEYIKDIRTSSINLGNGCAELTVELKDGLYYEVMSELCGVEIKNEKELISLIKELAAAKNEYDRVAEALAEVNATGYGIVSPGIEDLRLEQPEIVKQSGGYGVKLKASAPSIHMIKVETKTEVNPMIGSEAQSEDFVKYLLGEFEEDPAKIWSSKIFGKTLHELVTEGLHTKLSHMPADARSKLSETLQRVINEGSGGLICIIL